MGDYWVSSLPGIAYDDCSSIASGIIATKLFLSYLLFHLSPQRCEIERFCQNILPTWYMSSFKVVCYFPKKFISSKILVVVCFKLGMLSNFQAHRVSTCISKAYFSDLILQEIQLPGEFYLFLKGFIIFRASTFHFSDITTRQTLHMAMCSSLKRFADETDLINKIFKNYHNHLTFINNNWVENKKRNQKLLYFVYCS